MTITTLYDVIFTMLNILLTLIIDTNITYIHMMNISTIEYSFFHSMVYSPFGCDNRV